LETLFGFHTVHPILSLWIPPSWNQNLAAHPCGHVRAYRPEHQSGYRSGVI